MPLNPPQGYRKTRFILRRGLSAAKPAATDVLVGTLYFSSDLSTIERSNGTIWETYSGSGSSVDLEPVWIDGGEPSGNSFFGYNILDGGTP